MSVARASYGKVRQLQTHSARTLAIHSSSKPAAPLALSRHGTRVRELFLANLPAILGAPSWLWYKIQSGRRHTQILDAGLIMKRALALTILSALGLGLAQESEMQPVDYLSDSPIRTFEAPEQVLEPGKDYYAEIITTKGTVLVDLYEDQTPNTVNSFVFLALNHYYEGVPFHRVIPDFMAQTGDPTGTGTGGPGYGFGLEIVPELRFDSPGVLGMARANDPNSNGSQFFITFGATPHLNGQYTVFGKVVEGMDVINKITPGEPPPQSQMDRIESIRILIK